MGRLGYERFGAQGGDWGSAVTTPVGELYPDRVLGIHVNMPTVASARSPTTRPRASARTSRTSTGTPGGARLPDEQSTRPQTLGYGLVDSPVVSRVHRREVLGVDRLRRRPAHIFTREQLLDNVTVYWLTGTGASSGRLYWKSAGPRRPRRRGDGRADRARHRSDRLLGLPARDPSTLRRWAEQRFRTSTGGTSRPRPVTSPRSSNRLCSSTRCGSCSAPRDERPIRLARQARDPRGDRAFHALHRRPGRRTPRRAVRRGCGAATRRDRLQRAGGDPDDVSTARPAALDRTRTTPEATCRRPSGLQPDHRHRR